jgi:hypothetical protein
MVERVEWRVFSMLVLVRIWKVGRLVSGSGGEVVGLEDGVGVTVRRRWWKWVVVVWSHISFG